MKTIESVLEAPPGHWVGDGFPVRSLFSYQGQGRNLSPFLLLDYAEPIDEPIAGYGPFVMNTEREIREAISDFNSGRFGSLASQPAEDQPS